MLLLLDTLHDAVDDRSTGIWVEFRSAKNEVDDITCVLEVGKRLFEIPFPDVAVWTGVI